MLKNDNIIIKDIKDYPPIVLAYLGDAVFELLVRTSMVTGGKRKIKEIHLDTVQIVNAESQAKVLREVFDDLSEEEKDIVRRGRNAKSTPPRHADSGDYHMSTGFEALLGYLYLKGDTLRIEELVEKALHNEAIIM
ncbi:MAG TPA: ribonuclease III domain-containing protein [Syntrophomonadaceae bacterium]|nr:ribonuclease III domain-containing protein [Syntrophomonadaceae bacterium]HRX21195.1 ribonuclease III domain-containing protein [Syntrophomonadaceae bacterium]